MLPLIARHCLKMRLFRLKSCKPSRNHCFVLGMLLGLLLTIFIPDDGWQQLQHSGHHRQQSASCQQQAQTAAASSPAVAQRLRPDDFEPHLNLDAKPMAAKKVSKNIVRPRYYTSELGIREKLFVGVLTAQDRIDTLATAFNRTAAHLVDKIKFFINADSVRANFRLKNIVGFTDTRDNLRPFHVLKYIADNYLNDYDYFLLTADDVYVDVRRLLERLRHLSVSFDVYMGQGVRLANAEGDEAVGGGGGGSGGNVGVSGREALADGRYCDMRSGVLLSSSVIRKIRANLDWCVRSAVTSGHSVNVGRCVLYATQIGGCQERFQGIELTSFKLNTHRIYRDLNVLRTDSHFNAATFLHPVSRTEDVYTLHTYFSRLHLEAIKAQSVRLAAHAGRISNGTLPNAVLEVRWPLGVPDAVRPETRHDLQVWQLLNETHVVMPDHERNVAALSAVDAGDLRQMLNRTILHARRQRPDLIYHSLHTAYRRFDPVRGMDYRLFLRFSPQSLDDDTTTTTAEPLQLRSFEVVKPLGRVEIVTSPYVTESTRIALIVPVAEPQLPDAVAFLQRYEQACMVPRDNTFLMLVLLYGAETPSRGDADAFGTLKIAALNLTETYRAHGSRVAWVSIRLPASAALNNNVTMTAEASAHLSSAYGADERLSMAVTDLALRKIGLKSLVLLGSVGMSVRTEFLNRVRMNTIEGFQVFGPVGFRAFPCAWAHFCKECETCDVSGQAGYFDRYNSDVVAFYSQDYVDARKSLRHRVPIVHSDNDIEALLGAGDPAIRHVLDLFVTARSAVHVLRAIEPQLRHGARLRRVAAQLSGRCPLEGGQRNERCVHVAARRHAGDALVRWEEEHGQLRQRSDGAA